MPRYRDKSNAVLRDTIQASLGIPYLREEDLDKVPKDLYSIFEHIQHSEPAIYKFLSNFVDNYIEGYWLTEWDKSDICFWGDLSYFSSEHMTNNAIESHNNECYTLLGRRAHPNPYYFMFFIRKALLTTHQHLQWVEKCDYEETKSANAAKAVKKRQIKDSI
jgi:hypothetical protein